MLYLKAFHIIAMVAWFAGLFYLPRLFVYHAEATDIPGIARFKVMERRLYFGITWPAAILTTLTGIGLISSNFSWYLHSGWMQVKLGLVLILWMYHLTCGYYLRQFSKDENTRSTYFFRMFNEIPTVFLIGIVVMVVVKPF